MMPHRYAAFRTSLGFGPEVGEEPPGESPIPGAVLEGVFHPYGNDEEANYRWVIEVAGLSGLEDLARRVGTELIISVKLSDRYHGCYDLLDGVDGIVEMYDDYRD